MDVPLQERETSVFKFLRRVANGAVDRSRSEEHTSELHTNSYIFKMSSICKYAAWVASVHYNLMDARANVVTTHINSRSIYSPVHITPEESENEGFALKMHQMFSVYTKPKIF